MRRLPFEYAVRNLGRSKLRLVLSVAGTLLVVLLVLAAGGFVRGMSGSLVSTGDERNVMVLGVGSEESLERSEISAATASLLSAGVPGLASRMGVPLISPEVHVQLPVRAGGAGGGGGGGGGESGPGKLTLIRGITPAAMLVHSRTQITDGTLPRPGHDELLVGRLAYTKLGITSSEVKVGAKMHIEGRDWTISGILASPGSVIDGEIWMPLTDVKQLTKRETDSCVVATLGDGPNAAELADIQTFCRQRLDLEITSMTETAYYSRLAAFFAPVRIVTWATAGLIALGGLFGGLNTMYAAFASRVRELGMLQCLGYRRGSIVLSLMQESCLATAAGAIIASGLALLFLDGLAVQFSMGVFGLRIDAPVLALGMGAGLALGLVGALPPAFRCLRLPIPESLKSV